MLAKERDDMILEAIRDAAGVSTGIDFEGMLDGVQIENIVQFLGIDAQSVLVADIDRDGAILAQPSDVLIDESKRRIGRPFGENVRLDGAGIYGKVQVERRVFRVRRPSGGGGQLRTLKETKLGGVFGGFYGLECFLVFRFERRGGSRRQTTRTHDVQAAEDIGMLHADAGGTVAPHGMADQAATLSI